MARYLVELEHDATPKACMQAYEIILSSGSHFLTNAEWGCEDNEHFCWIMVDLDSKDEVRAIIPPLFRDDARIVELKQYKLEDFKNPDKNHQY